jgi:hypothetical protein
MKDINKRHIRGFLRNYINKKYILENIELLEPKDDVNIPTLEDYGHTLQDIVDIITSEPLEKRNDFDEDIDVDTKTFWFEIDTELEDDEGDNLYLRIDGVFGDNDIKITDIDVRDSDYELMIDLSNDLEDNEAIIKHINEYLETLVF